MEVSKVVIRLARWWNCVCRAMHDLSVNVSTNFAGPHSTPYIYPTCEQTEPLDSRDESERDRNAERHEIATHNRTLHSRCVRIGFRAASYFASTSLTAAVIA